MAIERIREQKHVLSPAVKWMRERLIQNLNKSPHSLKSQDSFEDPENINV